MHNLNDIDPAIVDKIAAHLSEIIQLLGENPSRPGLLKTPVRAAKAMLENTRGYRQQAEPVIKSAIFEHEGSQIVIVRDIEFYSLCEHHLLPFFGTIHIGYVPDGAIIGLSKTARVVDIYARRLQVQERLTAQICNALADNLPNRGVIVQCSAHHLCMKMRGVEKQQSATVTTHYTGLFADNPALRDEFRQLLQHQA